ncbi:MAG: DUF6788 family protein [Acidimicrobiales bacterium]
MSSGSITRRYTRCGTPGCKGHDEPRPYYQWTAKVDGKTFTRRHKQARCWSMPTHLIVLLIRSPIPRSPNHMHADHPDPRSSRSE